MKLRVMEREDVSAVFVVDENDETVLVDVNCNESLVREMVGRFNAYEALIGEVRFLLDRLRGLNLDDDTDEVIRDWNGHVEPSVSRLEWMTSSQGICLELRALSVTTFTKED